MDYVFANMYLHHVDLPQVAIEEMARVLKPGGKVIITDMDEHDFDFLRKERMTAGWDLKEKMSRVGSKKLG